MGKIQRKKSQWKEGSKSIYIQILEFIKNIVFSHHPHIKLFFNGKDGLCLLVKGRSIDGGKWNGYDWARKQVNDIQSKNLRLMHLSAASENIAIITRCEFFFHCVLCFCDSTTEKLLAAFAMEKDRNLSQPHDRTKMSFAHKFVYNQR